MDGAYNGLGNKGLGKIGRVMKGEEVLVKLLGGTPRKLTLLLCLLTLDPSTIV